MDVSSQQQAADIRAGVRANHRSRVSRPDEQAGRQEASVREIACRYDLRGLRAGEMEALSQELYQVGAIGFQDRALLSLQGSDLPDQQPRDYIQIWEDTVQRHVGFGVNRHAVERARRIHQMLVQIEQLGRDRARPAEA
jgi:hypothetical protein